MAINVKLTCMKTLPKMEINDELDLQINESIRISDRCKADAVRQAFRTACPNLQPVFSARPYGWRNGLVKLDGAVRTGSRRI